MAITMGDSGRICCSEWRSCLLAAAGAADDDDGGVELVAVGCVVVAFACERTDGFVKI